MQFEYKYDLETIKQFVNILPELEEKYVYLLMLQARARYVKQLLGVKIYDCSLMWDFVVFGENWREALLRKILRMVILAKHSDLVFKVKGKPVPPIATGVMLVINPARIDTAISQFLKELTEDIINHRWDRVAKLHKLWFSNLHRRTRRKFHTIDIDTKSPTIIQEVEAILDNYGGWFIKLETPRGFHYIIKLDEVDKEYFTVFYKKKFPELQKKFDVDGKPLIEYKKDPIEPIAGTTYGGFLVKMWKK